MSTDSTERRSIIGDDRKEESHENDREDSLPNRRDLLKLNTDNLPTKVYNVCFSGAMGSLHPYVSLYFKQLGFSPGQVGFLYCLKPFMNSTIGLVLGNTAENLRIRKWALLLSILCWIGFYLGIAYIDPPDRSSSCGNPPGSNRSLSGRYADLPIISSVNLLNSTAAPPTPFPTYVVSSARPLLTNGVKGEDISKVNENANTSAAGFENLGWIYNLGSLHSVFICILLILIFGELLQSPTNAITDSVELSHMDEAVPVKSQQRICACAGWGLAALCVGGVISKSRHTEVICGHSVVFSDYMIAFYAFASLMFCSFLSASQFKFKDDKAGFGKVVICNVDRILRVMSFFRNAHHGSWLLAVILMGVFNGVFLGFLFWHVDHLGGSQLTMGFASFLSCSVEFVVYLLSREFIDLCSHMIPLYFALVLFCIRFIIYSSMTSPLWIIPGEILQGMSFAFIWTAVTSYSAVSVPRIALPVLLKVINALYWGIGAGSGYLLGGLLIGQFGFITTYRAFAIISLLGLFCFVLAQKCSTKPDNIYSNLDALDMTSLSMYNFEESRGDWEFDETTYMDEFQIDDE